MAEGFGLFTFGALSWGGFGVDVTVRWDGYGRDTWGSSSWGSPVVIPAATGGVGGVSVSIDTAPTITGQEATGSVGSVSITLGTGVSVSVTGVGGTGGVGVVLRTQHLTKPPKSIFDKLPVRRLGERRRHRCAAVCLVGL